MDPSVGCGAHHSLHASLSKPARHDNARDAGEQCVGPVALDRLCVDPLHVDVNLVAQARVLERFLYRYIGIRQVGVLAHDRDRQRRLLSNDMLHHPAPVRQVALWGTKA